MAVKRVCDICGKDAKPHSFVYGREVDAAGSMDDCSVECDLCDYHYMKLLELSLKNLINNKYEFGSMLMKNLKTLEATKK